MTVSNKDVIGTLQMSKRRLLNVGLSQRCLLYITDV